MEADRNDDEQVDEREDIVGRALAAREWDGDEVIDFRNSWVRRAAALGDRDFVALVLRDPRRFLGPAVRTPLEVMKLIMPGLQKYVESGEGSGEAVWYLAQILETSDPPRSSTEIEAVYRTAAEMGAWQAAEWMGRNFNELLAAAEGENASAQLKVAELYSYGWGCKQNIALALKWYSEAARGGSAEADYRAALLYLDGIKIQEDRPEGLTRLFAAAKSGHVRAKERLEEEAQSGDIQAKDYLFRLEAGDTCDSSEVSAEIPWRSTSEPMSVVEREAVEYLVGAYRCMRSALAALKGVNERVALSEAITEQRLGILMLLRIPEEQRQTAVQILEHGTAGALLDLAGFKIVS
jgi:hypothetical protein